MSMFGSPNDISTSDPESSSDERDLPNSSVEDIQEPLALNGDDEAVTEESLQREETAEESLPDHEDPRGSTEWFPNTAEQHATLLSSSLLEFVYNVKAAEHLNYAHNTTRFHRESPEARALGARMYQGASKVLASNGIMDHFVYEEHWRSMRQQYIVGVDNLGLQTLNESFTLDANKTRERPARYDSSIVIHPTSRPIQHFHQVFSSKYISGRISDIEQPRELLAAMAGILATPAPYTDMRLLPSPTFTSQNRYQAEFWELKRLGKGGFGTVYHVKNYVDNRDYAIKKVPLDSKRFKKWRNGEANDTEALLKEIRTLARLEHCHIVRYHAAWIEPVGGEMFAGSADRQRHLLYLQDTPAPSSGPGSLSKLHHSHHLPSHIRQDEASIDVTFEQDSVQAPQQVTNGYEEDDSAGIIFGDDSHPSHCTPDMAPYPSIVPSQKAQPEHTTHDRSSACTASCEETDIFTDGDGKTRSSKPPNLVDIPTSPIMVLHIQMSLHPLSLATYLSPPRPAPNHHHQQSRHCFHLAPSLRLLLAILSGVEYLHSQGIVHRDLKPGNIFLSEHHDHDQQPGCIDMTCLEPSCQQPVPRRRFLNPRIGDFGLVADISSLNAAGHGTAITPSSSSSHPRRASPTIVGTEFYRPPRHRRPPPSLPRDHHHSSSSPPSPDAAAGTTSAAEQLDVFALGIILFELLYKMDTRMERHMLLTNLTEKGELPLGWAAEIDSRVTMTTAAAASGRVVGGGAVEGGGGGAVGGDKGLLSGSNTTGSHDHDTSGLGTVGELVEDCVRNMVCVEDGRGWGCGRVRERLEAVLVRL